MTRIPLRDASEHADALSRSDPALATLWELLEQVKDPEIPVLSLRELGVLRGIHQDADGLRVVITPTYSGCPAMRAMEDDLRKVLAAAGYGDARIETRLAPAWTTDWISEGGREALRVYGIAPPPLEADAEPEVACPHCSSKHTRRISEFGSTACKALYQCRDCQEPFDYFKGI